MTIDSEQTRFTSPAAAVSSPTFFACLDRLTVADRASSPIEPTGLAEIGTDSPVAVDRVLEIASSRGLNIDLVHLDWKSLQSAITRHDVLLLLQNSNVVAAIENSSKDCEAIVVSDPLYQNGTPFLLQRDVLEDAWRGDALVVKRSPEPPGYSTDALAPERNPEPPGYSKGRVILASLLVALAVTAITSYFAVHGISTETRYPTPAISVLLADGLDRPKSQSERAAEEKISATSSVNEPNLGGQTDRPGQPAEVRRNALDGLSNGSAQPSVSALPPNIAAQGNATLIRTISGHNASTGVVGAVEDETTAMPTLRKVATSGAIPQQEPLESSSDGTGPALGPRVEEVRTKPRPSEPAIEVVSRPTVVERSGTAPERDGWPIEGPSGTGSAVEAIKAATTNNHPSSPGGTPATVPEEPSSEGSYLLDYGDALISRADIASARLYYQRAADAGSAQGALRLGETYDPAFLAAIGVNERMADILLATKWYKRAVELGVQEVKILLEKL